MCACVWPTDCWALLCCAVLWCQVIQLVQRCLSEPQHESVRSMATHMLRRWGWQLAGHMQVRTEQQMYSLDLHFLSSCVQSGGTFVPFTAQLRQSQEHILWP